MRAFKITLLLSLCLVMITGNLFSEEYDEITNNIKSTVEFLSSDELQGRAPGTEENIKAQNYIAQKYKDIGLKFFNENPFQEFSYIDTINAGANCSVDFSVLIRKPGVPEKYLKYRNKHWDVGKDWIPMRFSKDGSVEGELVFCGYGITAPDINYDDYAGVDVNNKIVVVLADSSEGMPLDDFWYPYSDLSYKADNAKKHGASAIIFIKVQHDSANVFYNFDVDRNYKSDIIAIHANRTALSKLIPRNMALLKIEKEINSTHKPKSFVIPDVKFKATVEVKNVEKKLNNVIGYIEGEEKPDEYIVVAANFDGYGSYWYKPKWTPKVWTVKSSSNFNASGAANLLELAKYFKDNPPECSIIFAALNGGTVGNLGSQYFANNLSIAQDKLNMMFNIAGVGKRKSDKLYLIGTQTLGNKINYNDIVNDSTVIIANSTKSKCPSSHIAFAEKTIPAIMITTGFDYQAGDKYDTPDKIYYKNMLGTYSAVKNVVSYFANNSDGLNYIPDPAFTKYEKASKGYGCELGVISNMEYYDNGLIVSDIRKNSAANKAKMKIGDIILKINGKAINNNLDLQNAERLTKPKDEIEIVIMRDGTEKVLKAKMKRPPVYY